VAGLFANGKNEGIFNIELILSSNSILVSILPLSDRKNHRWM